jgi:hypothetical protein
MNKWDERYSSKEFFYGEKPNVFFAEYLLSLPHKGRVLLPAEGEGRNAIFAAQQGWEVDAFDSSMVAMEKSLDFAYRKSVEIKYRLLDLANFIPMPNTFDMVALIFVHMPEGMRSVFHRKIVQSLKKGGIILVESFAKEQINNNTGGPPDVHMLHSIETIRNDFPEMKILKLCQEQVMLNEGRHHGLADVVRFIGQMP